ncbi:hypothetical protein G9A89_004887 [Geosiphon pyriformis]|nr:hypothetical protein G9A89_004887 [Geosiphon pyriformis]
MKQYINFRLNSKGVINGSINVDNSRSNGKPKDINLNQGVGANSKSVIRGSLNSLASRGVGKEKYEGSFKIVDNGKDPLPIGNSNNCVTEGSVHYVGPDPEGFRSRCKVTGGFVASTPSELPLKYAQDLLFRVKWCCHQYLFVQSHVSDNDPNIIEKEKNKVLKGQVKPVIKSAPGWNQELASDSEAIIKAEREDFAEIKELQRESVKILHDNKEVKDE